MILVSRRYALPLTLLLAISAIPVLVRSYHDVNVDDCRQPQILLTNCSGDQEHSLREAWLTETFDAFQVCRGWIYVEGETTRLETTILRSFDPKKLYHNPETGLLRDQAVDNRTLQWIEAGDISLPIHRSHYVGRQSGTFAAYILAYAQKPVANPYLVQILSFPAQLVRGSRPMTLFFVTGPARGNQTANLEQAGIDWLVDSWQRYVNACGDPAK